MKQLLKIMIPFIMFSFGQDVASQSMKIISFNIRYNSWNNIDGPNGWPNRRAAVVKMIKKEKPAAIGLQEPLIDQLQYLDSCLPTYRRIGVGRDDGEEAGEFMAIYYDTTVLELTDSALLWLSETPEVPSKGWDAACYRTLTKATFRHRKSGKQFVYFNTHLDHVGKTAREESMKYIASIIESDCSDIPVIVGGDMNTTSKDSIFQSLYNCGLRSARKVARRTSNKNTYNGFGKDKPSLIDYLFVRGIKVKRFRTLNGNYGVPYISDHYPIEIKISL